ncbi:MAG: type IV pilus twitching motility protein PilT [Planctomycetota bacterium]
MVIFEILNLAEERQASDIILQTGRPISLRVCRKVERLQDKVISEEDLKKFLDYLNPRFYKEFKENPVKEIDFSFSYGKTYRYRANLFSEFDGISMVMRLIPIAIPDPEKMGFPKNLIVKLAGIKSGIILFTGITGSGKSTSIAMLIEYINQNFNKHIITIEDPIEFTFQSKVCVITQRELNNHTQSFVKALKAAMRETPDIIMVGEMRDRETVEAAMFAAETGHLVVSTFHTINTTQTIERLLSFYDEKEAMATLKRLSTILEAVIAQRLIPSLDNKLTIAMEVLLKTPTIEEYMLNGKLKEIYKALKEDKYFGCKTFNQSLRELVEMGKITEELAFKFSDLPEELKLELKRFTRLK